MAVQVPPYFDARALRAYLEAVAQEQTENLADVGDVTIASPANKELLTYNTADSTWINRTPAEADLYGINGTDVALADGGTGASLVDPNADRVLFWDDSAGAVTWLTPGSGISITTTSLNVADLTVAGDTGSTAMTPGDTLTITGGTNATSAMSGDILTVNVDDSFILNTGDVGTGVYDFGGATSFEIPNSATPTVDAAGEIAIDTTVTDYTGMMKYHDGVEELTVVAMPTANLTTTTGHVVVYNATNNEFEMAAQAGAGLSQATQAAIEAQTNEDTYIPPDLIKHSPGVAKCWGYFGGTGTVTVIASHNFDSITDNGTGQYTLTITTDFSSASYAALVTRVLGAPGHDGVHTFAVGSFQVKLVNEGDTATEDADFCVAAFGDQ